MTVNTANEIRVPQTRTSLKAEMTADLKAEREMLKRLKTPTINTKQKPIKKNNSGPILAYNNPMDAARHFALTGKKKAYWQGCLYEYTGSAYQETSIDDIKADIYSFLNGAQVKDKEKLRPYLPNRNRVGELLEALRAVVNLSDTLNPPCFISGDESQQGHISVENGILNLATRQLTKSTPDFFTLNALPFSFDRQAPPPIEWNKFLESIWPDDQQAIDTLQEVMGYLLSADTAQQKIFSVVGPPRSGKGTLGRILNKMLGPDNVCSPTLASLAEKHGCQCLIGKKAAIISDARLSSKADQAAIAERLLSISGEDHQGIPRKYLSDFNGPLDVRFIIFSNELPRLADASGALSSRFIMLTMKQSFLGKEDLGLTERLEKELPSILNWSLDGLDRLKKRGFFIQPDSGKEAVQDLADLSSPIGAFIRDRCVQGPEYSISKTAIYEAWCRWCDENGRDHPGTRASFCRDLIAAIPGLTTIRPGSKGTRVYMYKGIDLC